MPVNDYPPTLDAHWFHHRCYSGRATCNYLLTSRTGIELIDLEQEHWDLNHWVRGACALGIVPANGMIYVPPDQCFCYMEAKVNGYVAVASRKLPDEPTWSARMAVCGLQFRLKRNSLRGIF